MTDKLIAAVDLPSLEVEADGVIDVEAALELGIDIPSLISCGAAYVEGGSPVGTVSEPFGEPDVDPPPQRKPRGKSAKKPKQPKAPKPPAAEPEPGGVSFVDAPSLELPPALDVTIHQPETEVTDGN